MRETCVATAIQSTNENLVCHRVDPLMNTRGAVNNSRKCVSYAVEE